MSAAKVVPIRDPEAVVTDLVYELSSVIDDLPSEELTPGYTFAPETQIELQQMVVLLQRARRFLRKAIDREIPRYTAYDERSKPAGRAHER